MNIQIRDNGYEKQATLLKKKIEERISVKFGAEGLNIELNINKAIGAEESYIITFEKDNWMITGSDDIGLYHGIGKFLHTAKWNKDGFVPNPPTGFRNRIAHSVQCIIPYIFTIGIICVKSMS